MQQERLKVLVVDDDAVDRMAVKRNLRKIQTELEVIEAENCKAALDLSQSQSFDCTFVDYNLPDGNGVELVGQLRQLGVRYPLIALTGHGDEQVAVALMKAGASDYIAKDKIRPELLDRIMRQCLRLYAAQQESERIKQQREALLEQREEFISRMTHDMQTPLVGANRMLELIQEGAFGEVAETVQAKIDIITSSNRDLLKMVQDLVEVYSYEAGAKEINRVSVNMPRLVKEVLQQLEPLAIDKQLSLEFEITAPQLTYDIALDRAEIKRVLVNLIGNSLKFTETGGITIRLTGSSPSNPQFKITVSDTGVGISEADQTQLFKRFRRGKHKRSNSGLGLYLSRKIIESHQGQIEVESQVGQGTTFIILLPLI
ncbi:hybrid sensor histidine kinase/response regulator [Romeriopsis navalis]|uniref:hybrid sensor histidine kinase/response regulator n=1 Tax=Romeriopsis navalis TaxID=2992132 RepID=UPI0021F88CA4|nr:hybrid sensor histidine kinase/response regulator [Romeriopsis navalis]